MKSKFFAFAICVFGHCCLSVAQIPSDYPFKTNLDNMNNLYIAGFNSALDIESRKFSSSGSMLWKKDYPNPGFDRAYDLAVDQDHNVIVCGFVADKVNEKPRAIILKHRSFDGFIEFDQKPFFEIESGSYGVIVDIEGNSFSCGYILAGTNRDLLITKLNNAGDTVWTRTYNNPAYNKDDVATDILIDNSNLYVIGYTYNGPFRKNDIIHLILDFDGNITGTDILNGKGTNEIPTSFVIAVYSDVPHLQKSRTAAVVISDDPYGGSGSTMLTYYFKGDVINNLLWRSQYNALPGAVNIPTAIAPDSEGNVFVTGYSNSRNRSNYDFVTMKYNRHDGSPGWSNPSHLYYDSLNGNDKSSSIKVSGNRLYVAGTSDSTQYGYYIAGYNQIQATPIKEFDNVFIPSFNDDGSSNRPMQKAAVVEIDSSGNVYLIAQSWNETEAYFAIRKFSPTGEILYTIDPFENLFRQSDSDRPGLETHSNVTSIRNYPNPFNPATKITFSLSTRSDVTVKIYDTGGRLVKDLYRGTNEAGEYSVDFDATDLPSGIYYSVLTAGSRTIKNRMALVK